MSTLSGALSSLGSPLAHFGVAAAGVYVGAKAFKGIQTAAFIAKGRLLEMADAMVAVAAGEKAMSLAAFSVGVGAVGVATYAAGRALASIVDKGSGAAFVMDHLNKVQQTFASALSDSNGALDLSVKKTVGAELQQDGLAAAAQKSGISLRQLIGAVTDAKGPQGALLKQWVDSGKLSDDQKVKLFALSNTYGSTAEKARALAGATKTLADASQGSIGNLASSVKVSSTLAAQYATMMGIVVDKSGTVSVSQRTLDADVSTVADAYNRATSAGTAYLSALDTFSKSQGTSADRAALIGATLKAANGDALGFASAMNAGSVASHALGGDIAQAASQVGKGGESIRTFMASIVNLKTGVIDYTKSAAAPLINDLQGMQTAAMNAAQARFQHARATMSGKAAADQAYTTYKKLTTDALVGQAAQLHLTKDQADKLATTYFGMPKSMKTKIEQEGADPVVSVLNHIGSILAHLAGVPWNAKVGVKDHATSVLHSINGVLYRLSQGVNIPVRASVGPGIHVGGLATGGSLPNGVSAVGERGPELAIKHGSRVGILSNAQSKRFLSATGMRAPGFADGTGGITHVGKDWIFDGIKYGSQRAAQNAQTRASTAAGKLWLKIDGADTDKLRAALKSGADAIRAAFSALFSDLAKAGVSKSTIAGYQKQENALLAKRAKLDALLGTPTKTAVTAFDQLSQDMEKFKDLFTSVHDSILGSFNITTAGQSDGSSGTPSPAYLQALQTYQSGYALTNAQSALLNTDPTASSGGGQTFDSIFGALQGDVNDAKLFKKYLALLKKDGLSTKPGSLYAQLAADGPAALPTIDALLQGGKAGVTKLSNLYDGSGAGSLASIAGATGEQVAKVVDGAQLTHDREVVKELQRQQAVLVKKLDQLIAETKKVGPSAGAATGKAINSASASAAAKARGGAQ